MTKLEQTSGHEWVGATRPDRCDQAVGVNEWGQTSGCEWAGANEWEKMGQSELVSMNKWEQQDQMGMTREQEWMSGCKWAGATTRLDGCDQEVGMKWRLDEDDQGAGTKPSP